MKNNTVFLLLLIVFFTTSCTSILVGLMTKSDINSNLLIYENQSKKRVVLLPLVHIGKEKYYQSVKNKIDSLRKENFIILYEGVSKKSSNDTLERKYRRVAGYYFTSYTDSANKSLPKALKNKKYISQTRENTGIKDVDVNADYSLDSLIYYYEKKYKEIRLSECDLLTPLNSEYKCTDSVQHSKYYLLNTLRDKNLEKFIDKYADKNIVIIYGKGHKYMIAAYLRDSKYNLIKGKLSRF